MSHRSLVPCLVLGAALGRAAVASGQTGPADRGAATHALEPGLPGSQASEPVTSATQLARVKDLFSAASFAECAREARKLVDPESPQRASDAASLDKAHTYLAACLILDQQPEAGRRQFEQAIRAARSEHRTFPRPNTLVFPPPVIAVYDQVYGELEQEFRRADEGAQQRAALELRRLEAARERERRRQAELLELAQTETLVVRNRRWVAAIPFGVGQFQNRNPGLGWAFLVSELVALGVTVWALGYELDLHGKSQGNVDRERLNDALQTARHTWVISGYGLLGLMLAGVAEAQLRFVPELRETRRRPLPVHLRRPEATRMTPGATGSTFLFGTWAGPAGVTVTARF